MDQPLVSIITPCYNGEAYLTHYFASVLNQTYPNLELIFVNDGSADRTEEIALGYRTQLEQKGISYTYLFQENAGQAAALNRGLKLFTGDYLTWPDADDEMTPDCIEKKVEYLQAHPEHDMCVCKIAQVNENDPDNLIGILERVVSAKEDNLFEDLLFLKNVFYTPGGYMVRSSALDSVIPKRDIYCGRGGQNAQILLPVSYTKRYGYIDDILYKYFIRESSHSHSVNSAEKTLIQLEYFESILLETLNRMPQDVLPRYQLRIKVYYARMRYGNALDTRKPELIKKYYQEIAALGIATFSDWLRYLRYTTPILRTLSNSK